jgi:hypothetical protein
MLKNIIRIAITLFVLTVCGSTAILTDGGSPMPMCPIQIPDCIVAH